MTRLSAENYDTACGLAGDALLRRVPFGLTIMDITVGLRWAQFTAGVYIAADIGNTVLYVGSAVRGETGNVGDRIQEHVLAGRADNWSRLMIVPLRPDTEKALVRSIEGCIGLVFAPADTVRLPAMARRGAAARRR